MSFFPYLLVANNYKYVQNDKQNADKYCTIMHIYWINQQADFTEIPV